MPSSLIIVALAAAWLVVLVPMVARKRQAVVRTTDSALAARVVRSGIGSDEGEGEFAVSEPEQVDDPEPEEFAEAERPCSHDEPELSRRPDSDGERRYRRSFDDPDSERRYRPGRGGFDPEAAEIAARAKYAFRQRVVLILLLLALASAGVAGFLMGLLWWAHGAIDIALVSYLAYLRRQVRIENEIRQRRLARLHNTRTRRPAPRREQRDEYEVDEEPRRELVGIERRPSPASRLRGRAVVVDVEDEDPAFHELDDPGQLPFRQAVGE
ncbi:hypothetical protein FHX82_001818 [Amycolatopsis bartoniae]|uniref:Uncharacterized protein n=1 Tax=Amycolatopsis bartoniae TaxID=941986 RepID=A0A8H9IQC6_9PSEU|nr:gephyrin-like molybdotransferase receptor GlpR [Amycolatopsis bartoniae]MBB2934798.1 hypothetical protein [Amycolatopsis bartoniae]TVT02416.1 hypothetical protein FNH07_27255 [Amycolatopsis bartoniae]GHF44661.1 hypothetical protein GCM10017566_17080 [Amycolatopsis bartoniae]